MIFVKLCITSFPLLSLWIDIKFQEEVDRLKNEVIRLTNANSGVVEVLKERNSILEAQLEEKTKDYHTAMDVNRRLQSEVKQVI